MKAYFLKDNDNPISIQVDVDTIGVAGTRIIKKRVGGSVMFVTKSTNRTGKISIDQSGNLVFIPIGKSSDLRGSNLVITTIINIINPTDKASRDVEFNKLVITYTLEGGVDGTQTFKNDLDEKKADDTGQIIVVETTIILNPI